MTRSTDLLCDDRAAAPAPAQHQTAVSLVPDNLAAFALRALSARNATRTLDLQYYIWEDDVTGHLLAKEVLRAADRGVQVRLLVDDLNVRDFERELATLNQHPAITVRLYNPFQLRSWGALGKALEFLFAAYRLNHRMHNKAWIVDGELVILGGRNIGDEYFDASSQYNFRDLDLALQGPVAGATLAWFDRYWTCNRVRAIGQIAVARPLPDGLDELRRKLDGTADHAAAAPVYLERLAAFPDLAGLLATGRTLLPDDRVRVVADKPGKGMGRRQSPGTLQAVRAAVESAKRDVILISPYFVPGRRVTRLLTALVRSGVRVAVLTNSLAATDVLAVHGGYARYRHRLLRAGITLHELKRGGQEGRSLFGSGGASLHTKAACIDGELIFVGSFNLDARSARLNTEMGVFVRHPDLATHLSEEYGRLTDPARSWTVTLQEGRLCWEDGDGPALHHEPGSSLFRRALARILGWIPLEPQL